MYEQSISQYLDAHHHESIRLKAVLFDMDGVLFDSMKNHATAWHEAMKHYGMHMTREEAYMHEGRTGASTINIVSLRERGHEATEAEIKEIYHTKSEIFTCLAKPERMAGAYERTEVSVGQTEPLFPRHIQAGTDGNGIRCEIREA